MKKYNLYLIFLLNFTGWSVVSILIAKFGLSRGIKPHSWQEIYSDIHLFLLISFFVASIFTFCSYAKRYKQSK